MSGTSGTSSTTVAFDARPLTELGAQSHYAWSYSQLKNSETCLRRWYHYNIIKDVQEPETPQLREGNALHKAFEDRLLHGTALPLGLGKHEAMLAKIAATSGTVHGEQKLALDGSFRAVPFFGGRMVWFRTVIDVNVQFVEADGLARRATVFDWKTGKPADDHTQLALMALTLFAHVPHLERVRAALVFVNHGQTSTAEFVREDQVEYWQEILPRVAAMQQARTDQAYPPHPSGLCRRYCAVKSCVYHGKGG